MELSNSRAGRSTLGERAPISHWLVDWVGSRASMNAVVKRKTLFPAPAGNRTPGHPVRCVLTTLSEISRLCSEDIWVY
jgi:hypothetical protein